MKSITLLLISFIPIVIHPFKSILTKPYLTEQVQVYLCGEQYKETDDKHVLV